MTALFHRGAGVPRARHTEGCWIEDESGKRYLDAASGALVVNVGHGATTVIDAVARQLAEVGYVHPSAFDTAAAERYAEDLAGILPMDRARIYPVSGGSEAVETALKVARSYHLARGEDRSVVIGRELSYHGNTRGALDVSGRVALRAPYLPWLGHAGRVPGVLEYRCPSPGHPDDCGRWHASRLEEAIEATGPGQVAAFLAEPVGGAASGAAVPPDGYWEAISRVCREHGVLVIADEVMTGFGRTGAWFASEHFGLRPDIMTLAKGASSGYWPLGVCAIAGTVAETLETTGLTHGFTYSHHPAGAAAGSAVISLMRERALVTRAADLGPTLAGLLDAAIGEHPNVGDIRGIGLLLAVEFVRDRSTKAPFPREGRVAEAFGRLARDEGLIVYPSSGCAGGGEGDLVLVGPPLVVTEEELEMIAERMAAALGRMTWG